MDNSALSVIQGVDSRAVTTTLSQIANFQKVIAASLRDGQDYGVIPGTQKPTLLKPGAEKINMLLQTVPEYEFLEKTVDFENDFFNYEIRCTLFRNVIADGNNIRVAISQGVGSCNSHEKKYRYLNVSEKDLPAGIDKASLRSTTKTGRYGEYKTYQMENPDVASLANTILKMAKKRAYVDATLQLAALSDIFTQDIEDMDIGTVNQPPVVQKEAPAPAPSRQPAPQAQSATRSGDLAGIEVTFGKYKGMTLGQLVEQDRGYAHWLADKGQNPNIRSAVAKLLQDSEDSEEPKYAGEDDGLEPPPEDDGYADTPLPFDL